MSEFWETDDYSRAYNAGWNAYEPGAAPVPPADITAAGPDHVSAWLEGYADTAAERGAIVDLDYDDRQRATSARLIQRKGQTS